MQKSVISIYEYPTFLMLFAYLRAAFKLSSSLLAPVHTILPEAKIKAVVRGSLILIIAAAKRFGLYSMFWQRRAMSLKSRFLQLRFAVDTIFWSFGMSCWVNGE
jgi:hypothetical protein